jgi:PAS domain S-box-containing protein
MISLNPIELQCLDDSLFLLCGVTDNQLRLIHANRFFIDTFQLNADDYTGRSLLEATRMLQQEQCKAVVKSCLRQPGKVMQLEASIQQTSGPEQWFRWEINAVTDEYHSVQGLCFVGIDISVQQSRHSHLLNALMEGVVIINRKTEITECNTAAEKYSVLKPVGCLA